MAKKEPTQAKRKRLAAERKEFLDEIAVCEDVTAFAERMVSADEVFNIRDCFVAAHELSAYLTAVRNKSMVLGSRYVPGTVKAAGAKALGGDIDAARFLFDFLGLRAKDPVTQVNTQVQVNLPKLKDFITVDSDGEVIDVDVKEG